MRETEVKALNGFTALSNEELETVDGGSAIAVAVMIAIMIVASCQNAY
jgi:class IIb bacteriocin, lactobin A/cerein 7B family